MTGVSGPTPLTQAVEWSRTESTSRLAVFTADPLARAEALPDLKRSFREEKPLELLAPFPPNLLHIEVTSRSAGLFRGIRYYARYAFVGGYGFGPGSSLAYAK
jgi:hypothetical protein